LLTWREPRYPDDTEAGQGNGYIIGFYFKKKQHIYNFRQAMTDEEPKQKDSKDQSTRTNALQSRKMDTRK